MYEAFFRMARPAFQDVPDPSFFFASDMHREGLAVLEYALESRTAWVSLTGEAGLGKTAVVATFIQRCRAHKTVTLIQLPYPRVRFEDLLALIAERVGLHAAQGADPGMLAYRLQDALARRREQGERFILVIDEAQKTPLGILEKLSLFANAQFQDQALLQVVLVGKPELEQRLDRPRWRSIDQRISVRGRLQALSTEDAKAYIACRLSRADALVPEEVFTAGAVRALIAAAQGVPRQINAIATLALLEGLAAQRRPVDRSIVVRVARSLGLSDKRRIPKRRLAAVVGGVFSAAAAVVVALLGPHALVSPAVLFGGARPLESRQVAPSADGSGATAEQDRRQPLERATEKAIPRPGATVDLPLALRPRI